MQKLTAKENAVQAVKFVLFSCSAGLIQTGAFAFFHELTRFTYWPAYLIALLLSVLWNFTLNRKFTFQSAANVPIAMLKVLGYYCVFTPASTLWGNYLTETAGWPDYLVLFGTMVINMATEFLFCRFVVYRHSIGTGKRKPV
jgi:putative flippase GtrA